METADTLPDDRELLRAYVERGCGKSFAGLVKRHGDHVFAAAARRVNGDRALAADITQTVFADFARKAPGFTVGMVPGGWLHRHTGFTALKVLAREKSRRTREQEAAAMQAIDHATDEAPPEWAATAPYLDAALDALPAADRDAIVLRFFERRDFRGVGQALGVSDDTAQKRVSRALEKLKSFLTRRGALVPGAALPALLLAWAAPPAPAAVLTPLASRALASAASAPAAWWTAPAWRHALAGAALTAAVATVPLIVENRKAEELRGENAVLRATVTAPSTGGAGSVPARPGAESPDAKVEDLIAAAARAFQGGAQNVSAVNEGLSFLTRVKSGEMENALARIAEVGDEPARILLYKYLLSHWAESDPFSALQYARNSVPQEHRVMVCDGVLSAWAARNPEAVLGWNQKTSALATPPERESLMATVFKTMASRDLAEAFAWLERTPGMNDRAQGLRGILETVQAEEGRTRVLEEIDRRGDEELRVQARRAVVEHWARHDPAAAAAWVEKSEPVWQRTRLMDSLGFTWLQSDPKTAAAWWVAHAPGPDTLVKIVNVWAQQDPNAAGDWLSASPPGPASDTARMTFARQVADLDPESALRWAETVSDAPMRESTIDHIWSAWRGRDAAAARSFLQSASWPAERSARLEGLH